MIKGRRVDKTDGQTGGDRFQLVLEENGLMDYQEQTKQTEDQGQAKGKEKNRISVISDTVNSL